MLMSSFPSDGLRDLTLPRMRLCTHLSRLVSIPINILWITWTNDPPHDFRWCALVADIPWTGPYNCVGKQLAFMEIRSVTSSILRRYNVALAPGQTKEDFVNGMVDGFTVACPKLDLIFTPRE